MRTLSNFGSTRHVLIVDALWYTLLLEHKAFTSMCRAPRRIETAFDFFLQAYGPKYEKAAACLAKDRDALLSFYDFPAEHWKHVRTTNPIESTPATVRLRTYRTKGCLSRKTAMAMVFKLCQGASKKWRRLIGSDQFAEIIRGVKFVNGERLDTPPSSHPITNFRVSLLHLQVRT